jgi:hypothetical protein
VLTEPFADQLRRAMAYESADRPLPAIVLPHPIQNVSEEELMTRAVMLADAAEALLRGQVPGGRVPGGQVPGGQVPGGPT